MERLTKTIDGYVHGRAGKNYKSMTKKWCRGNFEATAIVEKLAEYEDAEEKGLLVRLPCRVGDTVYKVYEDIFQCGVLKKPFDYSDISDFGKTVFLTKAEAEAKLKEMEGENADSN